MSQINSLDDLKDFHLADARISKGEMVLHLANSHLKVEMPLTRYQELRDEFKVVSPSIKNLVEAIEVVAYGKGYEGVKEPKYAN